MMIFIGVMSNRNQNASLLNSRITQKQKIIGTFLKNDFVGKALSFHDG